MQFNKKDLPQEYLLAKLSFSKQEAIEFHASMDSHRELDDERRTTMYHFAAADIYHSS